MPVPTATDSDPVAFLTNGRLSWDCDGRTLKRHTSTTWISVADRAAPKKADLQMEQRVLDSAGDPVSQSVVPTAKQPLAGCSGGDAQIG